MTRLTLADVARCLSRTLGPNSTGIERVVGLDHLDSGDLRVRRWDDIAAGTNFTRLFQPGDVLLNKRRVYQRKTALATFPGVCSGDILVLEATDGVISSDLLALVVRSEAFTQFAVGRSAGSMSPRVKWASIKDFAFEVPDALTCEQLTQQVNTAIEAHDHWMSLVASARDLHLGSLPEFLERFSRRERVQELGEVRVGLKQTPAHRTGNDPRPCLRVANVLDGHFDLSDIKGLTFSDDERRTLELKRGDILVNEGQARSLVGRSAICDESVEGMYYQNTLLRFRPSSWTIPSSTETGLSGFQPQEMRSKEEERSTVPVIA